MRRSVGLRRGEKRKKGARNSRPTVSRMLAVLRGSFVDVYKASAISDKVSFSTLFSLASSRFISRTTETKNKNR